MNGMTDKLIDLLREFGRANNSAEFLLNEEVYLPINELDGLTVIESFRLREIDSPTKVLKMKNIFNECFETLMPFEKLNVAVSCEALSEILALKLLTDSGVPLHIYIGVADNNCELKGFLGENFTVEKAVDEEANAVISDCFDLYDYPIEKGLARSFQKMDDATDENEQCLLIASVSPMERAVEIVSAIEGKRIVDEQKAKDILSELTAFE